MGLDTRGLILRQVVGIRRFKVANFLVLMTCSTWIEPLYIRLIIHPLAISGGIVYHVFGIDYAGVVFSVTFVDLTTSLSCGLELPLTLSSRAAGALAFMNGQWPLVSLNRMTMKPAITKIQ